MKPILDGLFEALHAALPERLRGGNPAASAGLVLAVLAAAVALTLIGTSSPKRELRQIAIARGDQLGAQPTLESASGAAATNAGVSPASPATPDVSFRDARPLAPPAPAAASRDEAKPTAIPAPVPAPAAPAVPQSSSIAPSPPSPVSPTAASPPPSPPPSAGNQVLAATAAKPSIDPRFAVSCGVPGIAIERQDAGLMGLKINSRCRAGEDVHILYGPADFIERLDADGRGTFALDLFMGAGKSATIAFVDGTRRVIPVAARDLERVSKVAVIWRAPVDIDLHAFEYDAKFGQPGHVWAKTPSGIARATADATVSGGRGHGFISTTADGARPGDHVEVYTFLHAPGEATGSVSMALDYSSRGGADAGETCGSGRFAKLPFEVVTLSPDGSVAGGKGELRAAPCGSALAVEQRIQRAGLPTLRLQ